MSNIMDLSVKIFADGASRENMSEMYKKPYIQGFTTNPTLMRMAGITDYEAFSRDVLKFMPDRPISFEVFADDWPTMFSQAVQIASWGKNVYVKIPVMNTAGESSLDLIRQLAQMGVKLNVTALMTLEQVRAVSDVIGNLVPACISVFAGRIADTGRDPVPIMSEAVRILAKYPSQELIWASPRELINIYQADSIGCHIITVSSDVLKKVELVGKCLDEYSLETVKMFRRDAIAAGFSLNDTLAEEPAVSI